MKEKAKEENATMQMRLGNTIYQVGVHFNPNATETANDKIEIVVRRMFQMTIEGKGPMTIARIFTEEGIDRPGYRMAKLGFGSPWWGEEERRTAWRGKTVGEIIGKLEYVGHTVNLRTEKESYKSIHSVLKPKEDWLIFENTHPPIVDKQTWDLAQKCRKVKRRPDYFGETNPLTGLVYCADCRKRLFNKRTRANTIVDEKTGKERKIRAADIYICSTNNFTSTECSYHYIRTVALQEIILKTIKMTTDFARSDEEKFVELVRTTSEVRQAQVAKNHKKQISKNEKRINELGNLFKKIYELDGNAANNLEAFESIIRYMKENNIGYGSINHPRDQDPVCGYNGIIGDVCPKCGRAEDDGQASFERIRRITGYLVGTLDRFNNAKRSEESDRVKHNAS